MEDVEETEDIEEDEFARWTLLRGMPPSILLTSSVFMLMAPCPRLAPHPDRLFC